MLPTSCYLLECVHSTCNILWLDRLKLCIDVYIKINITIWNDWHDELESWVIFLMFFVEWEILSSFKKTVSIRRKNLLQMVEDNNCYFVHDWLTNKFDDWFNNWWLTISYNIACSTQELVLHDFHTCTMMYVTDSYFVFKSHHSMMSIFKLNDILIW